MRECEMFEAQYVESSRKYNQMLQLLKEEKQLRKEAEAKVAEAERGRLDLEKRCATAEETLDRVRTVHARELEQIQKRQDGREKAFRKNLARLIGLHFGQPSSDEVI